MRLECKDLDHALREGSPELINAISEHARSCSSCSAELRRWREMSAAAQAMRRNWDSPDLWPRIQQALAVESQAHQDDGKAGWAFLQILRRNWQVVAAAGAVILLTASVAWILMRSYGPALPADPDAEKRLLTEKALREIETTETAYIQSIDRLSRLVEPRIEKGNSPLLVSYREKLSLLDAAIADCRANIERNRFNAHMRRELISIYQEKQRTLEDVMRVDKNDLQ